MSKKLKMMSSDIIQENIDYIASRFPNVIKETKDDADNLVKKIDFDILKQELSTILIDDKKERYHMTWPDKKNSVLLANTKTNGTLRPLKNKSVDFDNTKNIYIEGDNLEVLKLLRETYLNKIKMIYIDPPYNTGNDFIYNDVFKKDAADYMLESGQYDEQGNRLRTNTEANGRFHTDWLNMMYPRLKVAKDLLAEDGVIFISINQYELQNMLKLCDEIFGEKNYIENFIWNKNSTKNLSKTTSTNHEYIVCYAKEKNKVDNIFRREKPGLKEVNEILNNANKNKLSIEQTESILNQFYKKHPELKGISMYNKVDFGNNTSEQKYYQPYRLSDISAPKATGVAETYEVIHPKTGLPCKTPSRGWAFTRKTMEENIKNNLIYFYDDEKSVPQFKRYLDTVTTEVMKSTFDDFTDGKKELMRLFGGCPFENPKPTTLILRFLPILSQGDIVLDFFSGSGTTADAVMQYNFKNQTNLKYIIVNLNEKIKEKTVAADLGFKTICDLGEERIRRAGKKIKNDNPLTSCDIGFRVLKLDSSNMNEVYYNPNAVSQNILDSTIDNVKHDRTSLDLLFQVMLDLGIELSAKIEEKTIDNKKYFIVNENDIVACFDDDVNDDVIHALAKLKPLYAVFKDSSFISDAANINCEQIFKTISRNTTVKVI